MLSPGSSGLFAKAIAQSGAFYGGLALRPKSAAREAEKGPYKVLAEIGKKRLKNNFEKVCVRPFCNYIHTYKEKI